LSEIINKMLRYKAWADEVTFQTLLNLPDSSVTKERKTNFGTISHTLNHVFVVDDIFRHHLTGETHSYSARNTKETPQLADLFEKQKAMNKWYIARASRLDAEQLTKKIHFRFIGGGDGQMSQEEIFLHVVNHATYHRGFVSDMMYQIPARPPANDFPVFLREDKA
jgi:uncharacterized damage-inducible protein DinB